MIVGARPFPDEDLIAAAIRRNIDRAPCIAILSERTVGHRVQQPSIADFCLSLVNSATVQFQIHGVCKRRGRSLQAMRSAPSCLERIKALPPAFCARPVPGGKSNCFVQEEQLGVPIGRHGGPTPQSEFKKAGDPTSALGVTFRRTNKKGWELPFVSVIDCRGEKRFRSYYTKWHELGHLLILTDQMRLTFRRTHFELEDKDPEEALVDVIAGAFGFLPDLVRPQATGKPTFERIEEIRTRLCPEASQQASLIGIAKAWPTPCILLQAQMGLKRGEKRDLVQSGFDFQDVPKEVLRAVQVTPNDAARAVNFVIFQNMRVPARSLITEVHLGNCADAQAVENLSWWESSDGSQLPDLDVFVQARQAWGGVQAIISLE